MSTIGIRTNTARPLGGTGPAADVGEVAAPRGHSNAAAPLTLVAPPLAASKPKAALGNAGVQVVLDGLAATAEKARTKAPAAALAAVRQITKQLAALKPADGAGVSTASTLALLAPLSAALDTAAAAPGRAGAEATRARAELGAALDRLPLPLGSAALTNPALAADPKARALLAEALDHNPHPAEALAILGRAPDIAAQLSKAAAMYPPRTEAQRAANVADLHRDLATGGIARDLTTKMTALGLSDQDQRAFFAAFAEVRAGFASAPDDMQRVNWMHTRIEILHTLDAATTLGLDAKTPDGRRGLLASLYGSLCSDAFKDQGTFSLLWHNRPGAELIAPLVMGRAMQPVDAELLRWTMRVAHEHQVTPPLFMAGPMKATLGKLVGELPAGADRERAQRAADEVFQAVSKPLAAPQQDGEITFSADARALLEQAGLSGWAVPHASPWNKAAQAAIAGDVWQYVSPEGVIKIAVDLRDPGSPAGAFMRDPVISMGWLQKQKPDQAMAAKALAQGGAIESSVDFSFGQGVSVIDDPQLLAAMKGHQAAMKQALDAQVLPAVEARLRSQLGVAKDAPTPDIPYWNTPVPIDGQLTLSQRASADRVKQTFQAVLAEIGQVPLDPFHRSTKGA